MDEFQEVPLNEKTASQSPATEGSRRRGARGQKLPFTFEEIACLYRILESESETQERAVRDLALLGLGFDTSLRGSFLLRLKVSDVEDSLGNVRGIVYATQGKSKGQKSISHALIPTTQERIRQWIDLKQLKPNNFLFPGQYEGEHLSRRQYANIVKGWAVRLNRPPENYASHSTRRSKPVAIYDKTKNARICQEQLGHSSLACTHIYLNVSRAAVHKVALSIRPF